MSLTGGNTTPGDGKSVEAFRTISEVASIIDVPQHVLRFWESKFTQVKPLKRGGGRRYYRPADVDLLRTIRSLLYDNGYTIKGVQKLLRDGVVRPDGEITGGDDSGPIAAVEPAAAAPDSADAAAPQASADRQELKAILGELESLKAALDAALGKD
jgi:DNA-binding transcriptional MerR regulator